MKSLASKRAGDGAVGTDQREIESQLLSNGKGESVAATGGEDDFDTLLMGTLEGRQISRRNLELRVEQSTVDVDG